MNSEFSKNETNKIIIIIIIIIIRYFVQIHTYFLLGAVFRVNFADAVYLYQNFTTLYVKSAQNSESRDISR